MVLRVAQVGAFKKSSMGDMSRTIMAMMWLVDHKALDIKGRVRHDPVNLKYGRDFLQETEQYDIVIVHCIFDVKPHELSAIPVLLRDKLIPEVARVSPLHSIVRWRARLLTTRAEYIFVFEDLPKSINGWKIGDLVGYKMAHRDPMFTAYKRKEKSK